MISTDNSVQKLRNQKLNKTKCDFLDQIRLVRSSPDSPPLPPPGGGFSGGLSENECKYLNERDHKIYTPRLIFGWRVNFFFPTWKVVPGACFGPKSATGRHLEHPEKVGFLPERARKRVKEWRDATFMKE